MDAGSQKRDAGRLLSGLESGGLSASDAAMLAERLDPVLHYAIVSFLRAVYPGSNPAASAVLERVVKLATYSPALVRRYEEGKQDPVSRWLESAYDYQDFRGRGAELIAILIEKIES